MKIRNGFVSNSSSSSFIIYGNEVKLSDVKLDNNNIYYAVGKELCEGYDVIDIGSFEMLHALRLTKYPFEVFKVTDSKFEENITELLNISLEEYWDMSDKEINDSLRKKIPGVVKYLDIDNSCTIIIEDVINKYDLDYTEEEIIKGAKNYYRELKLNRLLNK